MFSARSPRAVAHALLAPGQLGLSRAYVSGELEVDDIDAVLDAAARMDAAADRRRDAAAAAARRAARRRAHAPAAPAGGRAAPARQAPQHRPRRARRAPSLRRRQRVLRAVPRRLDDVLVRDLRGPVARRRAAGVRPGAQARDDLPQARADARRARARRRLRLGQLRASTRRRATAPTSWASRCRSRRPRWRASAPRRPASPTSSRSASPTTARWAASSSTRSPASGWSSTSAARSLDEYAATLAGLLAPGGRLLNHGIARLRAGDGRGGRVLRALRLPRRGADAALEACSSRSSARASSPSTSRATPRTTRARSRTGPARLDAHAAEGERLAGPERMRVWRLYLRAARSGFQTGFTSIYQVRCRRA